MNPQMNISPEEWNALESFLEQQENLPNSVPNEELEKIVNRDQKLEHIRKVREEIEDCIRQSKIKEFHKSFEDFEDTQVSETNKTKGRTKYLFIYSGAAILIVLTGLFWMLGNQNTSDKIFANNFKPDIGLPLKMGPTNSYDFYEGMVDYKQEKYMEAIEKWRVLLNVSPENDTINYFLGVANLALGNVSESLEYLDNQERFKGGIFENEAAYYAALAKIKNGDFDGAKTLLKHNPSPSNTKLLQELEKK